MLSALRIGDRGVLLRVQVEQVKGVASGGLVVAVARTEITAADILFCADEMRKAGLRVYRKIYNLTQIARAMPQADVHLVGQRLSAAANNERFGPAAIVTSSAGIAELARILEDSSVENRQIRVFREYCRRGSGGTRWRLPSGCPKQGASSNPRAHVEARSEIPVVTPNCRLWATDGIPGLRP